MNTEMDKRSKAFFTRGYNLQQDNKLKEAEESYLSCIECIDTDFRPSVIYKLYEIYREWNDKESMKNILELGIFMCNKFNEQKADKFIAKYPELKNDILESLETNKPHPTDWPEKGINPLFRPHETFLMIDLLNDIKRP